MIFWEKIEKDNLPEGAVLAIKVNELGVIDDKVLGRLGLRDGKVVVYGGENGINWGFTNYVEVGSSLRYASELEEVLERDIIDLAFPKPEYEPKVKAILENEGFNDFETESLVVGVHNPSDEFSKWAHISVIGKDTRDLVATFGYTENVDMIVKNWEKEDYLIVSKSIESAQLFCRMPKLMQLIKQMIKERADCKDDSITFEQIKDLLVEVYDIEETAERLLGEDAMKIINEAKNR